MEVSRRHEFASYWMESSASKSPMEYISLDFDGMLRMVAELLGGVNVPVDTVGFANDLVTFRGRDETIRCVRESDQLIADTVQENADAVAAQIEKTHAEETAPLFYNDEQALRSVIKLAYFSYKDYFIKFEELPSGDGYADIVYFSKKSSPLSALVIESRWNCEAENK